MGIGERLKMARSMARLSQRDLAKAGDVSAMSISNYERNLAMPSSAVLLRLARALGVSASYLLQPVTISLGEPCYRAKATLGEKGKQAVLARVHGWLCRYAEVEALFPDMPSFAVPDIDRRVASMDDIERVAEQLREAWELGLDPIDNLVHVLEQRGIKVGIFDADGKFDGLHLWANGGTPVLVTRGRDLPGDRQRLSIAHELGHLILEFEGDMVPQADGSQGKRAEDRIFHRFAGAFLVPREAALAALGPSRQTLGLQELYLLKRNWGISMQAWIHRAQDLDIIPQAEAARLYKRFGIEGWHNTEPGDPYPPVQTDRLKRLVLRAMAEGAVTPARAAELLDIPLSQFIREQEFRRDVALSVCG